MCSWIIHTCQKSRDVLEVRKGIAVVPDTGGCLVYSKQVRAVVFLLIVLCTVIQLCVTLLRKRVGSLPMGGSFLLGPRTLFFHKSSSSSFSGTELSSAHIYREPAVYQTSTVLGTGGSGINWGAESKKRKLADRSKSCVEHIRQIQAQYQGQGE